MKEYLKNLFNKHKEIILYCIFGALTTIVNIITYYAFSHVFDINYMISNIIAWIISVLFAYVTNKIYVFKSYNIKVRYLIKEFSTFVSCRLLSGILDIGIMYIFVDVLNLNDFVVKIVANIIVIIINYILSKVMIFKK
ncbi:putative flippase GtrA [Clostridium punense]|uniref:Flippase GtrA n=1 Tax=Clostridium punense TaxID=1054297 RepID=A0ABS4K595_9CLOT|nr:GtrA family protein [Clostridium punense]MBP2022321.1 putative flippase GtrA [Clostridium punense]